MTKNDRSIYLCNLSKCPDKFPTHRHTTEFWEHLGRAVATFGFLEEVLAKAYFALTATKNYPNEKTAEDAYKKWQSQLENALYKNLFTLAEMYAGAAKKHNSVTLINIDELEKRIKEAADIRNALCHGSWRIPNQVGKSTLFFLSKDKKTFDSQIDVAFLKKVQYGTAEIICDVISSITLIGFHFPSSSGPGEPIF